MLVKNKIINIVNIVPELLKTINIFALFVLFCTKYYVYNIKENINSIEKHIVNAKNKQDNLSLEIDYLTNPARLKNIYNILEKNYKLNMQHATIGQEANLQEFKELLKEKRK